ncbi:putative olfactory receptor 52L2 [Neosynchiropus ocellatus]
MKNAVHLDHPQTTDGRQVGPPLSIKLLRLEGLRLGLETSRRRWHRTRMPAGQNLTHTTFVFDGFPELQGHRHLLALPLTAVYVTALAGNATLLCVVVSAERLHAPMYLLIGLLCVVDIAGASAIVPSTVLALLFDQNRISLAGCLAQMFVTHFLSSVESTLLLAMALDRYVAVCRPLRYAEIMDSSVWLKLLLFTVLRSSAIIGTLVGLAASLQFCGSNVLQHCYCDHMALVGLACGDTRSSRAAGLAVIVCFVGVDIPLIFYSYLRILSEVLRASGGEERWKAFHTCGTHLMVMMTFYLVGSVTFLSHNLNIPIPTDANTFLALMYILVPATINPVIYGVRTAEIRNGFYALFKVPRKVKVAPSGPGPGGLQTVRCDGTCRAPPST